ncbi:hypothetical protein [Amycolatopsis sp. NPDC003861]
MPALTRVPGAVTAAYSATIIAAPRVLAKPCGLTTPAGGVTAGVRTLIAGIGARDAAIGLAMLLAPEGKPLQVALAARVASDAADAVVFGTGFAGSFGAGEGGGFRGRVGGVVCVVGGGPLTEAVVRPGQLPVPGGDAGVGHSDQGKLLVSDSWCYR